MAERRQAVRRDALGFRVFARGDEDKMVAWLAEQVCPSELNEDRQREAVLARCRAEKLEPPGRMERIIGAANRIADERFCADTVARLSADAAAALRSIVAQDGDGEEPDEGLDEDDLSFFTELKSDQGKLGLETLLAEITTPRCVPTAGCWPPTPARPRRWWSSRSPARRSARYGPSASRRGPS